jgi:hypothetical protein
MENGDSVNNFLWEDMRNYREQKRLFTSRLGCRVRLMIEITFWNLSELFFNK